METKTKELNLKITETHYPHGGVCVEISGLSPSMIELSRKTEKDSLNGEVNLDFEEMVSFLVKALDLPTDIYESSFWVSGKNVLTFDTGD